MLNQIADFLSFRFAVAVDGINYAAFTEFTLPTLTMETTEIKEGGQNSYAHKLPVRVTVGSATLKHGIATDLTLLNWYMDMLKGDIASATRQVRVTMFDTSHLAVMTWTFRQAYPIKWSGPSLKTDNSSVGIEEIEFVHHGFDIA
jgi:phage tail-like protein